MALLAKQRTLPYPSFHSKVSELLNCTHCTACTGPVCLAGDKSLHADMGEGHNCVPISLFDSVKLNDTTTVEEKYEPIAKIYKEP